MYEYKTYPPHLPHSPFPYALSPPTGTQPRKDLFYPLVLHFLKCMLLVIADILCLNQINPIITYSFLYHLLPYYSIAYSVLCIIFICRWNASILFTKVLFPSPACPTSCPVRPTNTILFSLSHMCVCLKDHICTYVHISLIGLTFTY
jgi:hypothetical protein